MNYFKEAVLRWRGQTPSWFKKTQAFCGAVAAMGATIAGATIPSGKLSWVTTIGGVMVAVGTVGGAICQFAVTISTSVLEEQSQPVNPPPQSPQP